MPTDTDSVGRSSVCVLIPCLNERLGIRGVIEEFQRALPEARILVVDNGSDDDTADVARSAGAEVIAEPRRGKARAVETAFCHIDEDVVIMVDGDGSYPAEGAHRLLTAYRDTGADLITGIRTPDSGSMVFRRFHQLGTAAFGTVLRWVFSYAPTDLFSGLRLFSRRYYKNVPLMFRGFELETELTVQAVDKQFRLAEVAIPFRARAEGSSSKLRTVSDGFRILRLMIVLFRDYRPFFFFGLLALFFFIAGATAGALPVHEYFTTRLIGRFPLAILAAALMNLSLFSLLTGIMLQSALRHRREAYQIEIRKFR
jgi:glycosyltransferase involved in cell wall biosynthesis